MIKYLYTKMVQLHCVALCGCVCVFAVCAVGAVAKTRSQKYARVRGNMRRSIYIYMHIYLYMEYVQSTMVRVYWVCVCARPVI